MTGRLTEYRYWSPTVGADVVRLSAFNERGHEFWMLLPDVGGARYRHKRQEAAEAIDTAIRMGLAPGEVRIQ